MSRFMLRSLSLSPRFLRSSALKTKYKNIYRPSTGAVMLLAALHTCDKVDVLPLAATAPPSQLNSCVCPADAGERLRLHDPRLQELLGPLLRQQLPSGGLLHQPRPADGDESVAAAARRRRHAALHAPVTSGRPDTTSCDGKIPAVATLRGFLHSILLSLLSVKRRTSLGSFWSSDQKTGVFGDFLFRLKLE